MQMDFYLQVFESHTNQTFNVLVKNTLSEPVYGQIFRIEPLSGTDPIGMRLEFYGCGKIVSIL